MTDDQLKDRILKYLKYRKKGVWELIHKCYGRTGEVNPILLEVAFTYKAIISDIKKDKLDIKEEN